MNKIYEMKLHEQITVEDNPFIQITRVAGGWIYRFFEHSGEHYQIDSVFVPFDNQFMETRKSNWEDTINEFKEQLENLKEIHDCE